MAPLLLSYGKALYELAFASQGVMGKEEVDKAATGAGGFTSLASDCHERRLVYASITG